MKIWACSWISKRNARVRESGCTSATPAITDHNGGVVDLWKNLIFLRSFYFKMHSIDATLQSLQNTDYACIWKLLEPVVTENPEQWHFRCVNTLCDCINSFRTMVHTWPWTQVNQGSGSHVLLCMSSFCHFLFIWMTRHMSKKATHA